VVSLLALLVVASMIVVTPASARWKTHPAPAFQRAVIALHATDLQTIGAQQRRGATQLRLQNEVVRLGRATKLEQAVRDALMTAPAADVSGAASSLITATRQRVEFERSIRALQTDLAFTTALVVKAQQRRAVVLAGLSLEMRQRVLRADHVRRRAAHARRATAVHPALLAPVPLEAAGAPGDNGVDLARRLDAEAQAPAASGTGAIAAAYALTQLGVRYASGGMSPRTGFDCSGLLYWAFAQAGLAIPRTSWQIWAAGRRVPRSEAQPGDVVSFHGQGHVGIYLGHGLYVHSVQSGDVVSVHALSDRTDLDGFVRLR
jgi:cell wall-associated NlpC family hydrolase